MKLLLYCTKAKPILYNVLGKYITTEYMGKDFMQDGIKDPKLNGKIDAECDIEVEKIMPINVSEDDYDYGLYSGKDLLKESCLSNQDIYEYLQDYNGGEIFDKGYAIHIKNLHIFDEPRNLEDYVTWEWVEYPNGPVYAIPKKPLSKIARMTKVMSLKYNSGDYVISLSPEEMCRVLNGKQTCLVRKKVLKEML